MLTMTGLTKSYRTDTVETTALDCVDLDIADGEFVAIMGPSGCGKSTLLNVMGMLDSPTGGSYVFNGQEVAGLSEAQLAYAASDVLHLHGLRERLDAMLAREGRTELAQACFDFLPTRAALDLAGWPEIDIFAHA